jgi:hypothetical protein
MDLRRAVGSTQTVKTPLRCIHEMWRECGTRKEVPVAVSRSLLRLGDTCSFLFFRWPTWSSSSKFGFIVIATVTLGSSIRIYLARTGSLILSHALTQTLRKFRNKREDRTCCTLLRVFLARTGSTHKWILYEFLTKNLHKIHGRMCAAYSACASFTFGVFEPFLTKRLECIRYHRHDPDSQTEIHTNI